jgi:hypothetical protein
VLLQDKIQSGDPRPRIVKPRLDPVARIGARVMTGLDPSSDEAPSSEEEEA